MPTATAAVLAAYHAPFELQEVEVDRPRHDEVLIRIAATGLCHSDLSVREGITPFPMPGIIGHEGAGVVEEVGAAVVDLAVGDHVVISFSSCGRCRPCRTGHPVYCADWASLNLFGGARPDGSRTVHGAGQDLHAHFFGQSSFSTLVLAPERSVVKVPKEAPLELLGPLACGVQTGAQSVLNVLRPEAGSTLAVFGAGGVGLSALVAAVHLTGAAVVVVDVNPARLALAKRLGAAHVVDARDIDPVVAIAELTDGRGADRSLETSGVTAVLRQAVDVLAPLGVCGIVGAPRPDEDVALNVLSAIVKGTKVVGINQGDAVPRESIPALVELHRQGRFPFDELIEVYDFADIEHAAQDAAEGRVVKPVLRMPRS
jgi:aryl-alcohol dehydrogenase